MMTKEYVVFEGFLNGVSLEISEGEYEEVKRFREVVVTAFSIEETFMVGRLADASRMMVDIAIKRAATLD